MPQLTQLGMNVVIYPVTLLRLAMKAAEEGLSVLQQQGTQTPLLDRMQTRAALYELLGYTGYQRFDDNVADFKV